MPTHTCASLSQFLEFKHRPGCAPKENQSSDVLSPARIHPLLISRVVIITACEFWHRMLFWGTNQAMLSSSDSICFTVRSVNGPFQNNAESYSTGSYFHVTLHALFCNYIVPERPLISPQPLHFFIIPFLPFITQYSKTYSPILIVTTLPHNTVLFV